MDFDFVTFSQSERFDHDGWKANRQAVSPFADLHGRLRWIYVRGHVYPKAAESKVIDRLRWRPAILTGLLAVLLCGQGLAYSVHSGVQAFMDTGLMYVYAATDVENFSKVLKSILKELRDVKKHGVTEEELRRSKDHLKGSLMLSLESTSSRMNRLAKHELHLGSFLTIDEMLASIDGVRHDEVQALVSQVIDEEQLALTTLGPLDRRNLPAELR